MQLVLVNFRVREIAKGWDASIFELVAVNILCAGQSCVGHRLQVSMGGMGVLYSYSALQKWLSVLLALMMHLGVLGSCPLYSGCLFSLCLVSSVSVSLVLSRSSGLVIA